jgi:hypothetical protein
LQSTTFPEAVGLELDRNSFGASGTSKVRRFTATPLKRTCRFQRTTIEAGCRPDLRQPETLS